MFYLFFASLKMRQKSNFTCVHWIILLLHSSFNMKAKQMGELLRTYSMTAHIQQGYLRRGYHELLQELWASWVLVLQLVHCVLTFFSKRVSIYFCFVLFVLLHKPCPLAGVQVSLEECLLKSLSPFFCVWINEASQVQRNDMHWIDVSLSNTQSKYICIHWAALLHHSALAAAPRDSLHPQGDTGRLCEASCWLLNLLYLCIS